MLGYKTKLDLV